MASLIDAVRKLHSPVLAAVDGSYDVDVICGHCTALRTAALDVATNSGEDFGYGPAAQRENYPCPTIQAAGVSVEAGRAEADAIRFAHFEAREQELRDELEYIETVKALRQARTGDPEVPAAPDETAKTRPKARTRSSAAKTKAAAAPEVPAEAAEKPSATEGTSPASEGEEEPVAGPVSPGDQNDQTDDEWDF